MFGDINQITILGNVTKDPQQNVTPAGTVILNFSVATNRSYKFDDEWRKETTYHDIAVFGKKAESLSNYIQSGTRVFVQGYLKYKSYEKDGVKKMRCDVYADEVILLSRYANEDSKNLVDLPENT